MAYVLLDHHAWQFKHTAAYSRHALLQQAWKGRENGLKIPKTYPNLQFTNLLATLITHADISLWQFVAVAFLATINLRTRTINQYAKIQKYWSVTKLTDVNKVKIKFGCSKHHNNSLLNMLNWTKAISIIWLLNINVINI